MSVFDKVPENYERKMEVVRAIAELSRDTPLSRLRIESICDCAHISRTTFYRLFENKYDAVDWYHQTLRCGTASDIGRSLTCHEGTLAMNRKLYEDSNMYRRIYACADKDLLELGARINAKSYRQAIIDHRGAIDDVILDYEIEYWSSSIYLVIAEWAKKDFPGTPEMLTDYMDDIRPRRLAKELDDAARAWRAATSEGRSQA